MAIFNDIKTVIIDREAILRAEKFSRQVIGTVNYFESNQFNKEKIIDDHFIGKLGEEAVKKLFIPIINVIGPDYNIYTKNQKSFDHDLILNKTGVSVKTQKRSSARKYGLSWTFQYSDKRKDPIFKHEDEWVFFVEYDDENRENHICFVYPPYQMKELTFQDPMLNKLVGKKKVIYASDLPDREKIKEEEYV